MARWSIRFVALGYLLVLLILPLILVLKRTFEHGISDVFDALTSFNAVHAFQVTAVVAGIAVVCNTVFGVGTALLLVRHRFPGRRLLDAVIDLPVAVSPVIVGLALTLIYGSREPVGGWLTRNGLEIIFSLPGMVLATIFVGLPLVVRAIAPVLEEIGDEQEQAAYTLGASAWQTFRRITLPAIRGALAYGVVLALARSLGEYGAVAVVSGRIVGQTQTITLFVEERFDNFDQTSAYSAAFALAVLAVVSLLVARKLRPAGSVR
jgi:sulfate transport system permease protein